MSTARRTTFSRRITSVLALAILASTAGAQGRATASGAGTPWDAHVAAFIEAYYAAMPNSAVNAGRHEYDGQLPDFSPAGLAALDTLLTNWRSRTAAFDTSALDANRRFERQYVLAILDRMLWAQKSVDAPHRNPAYYSGALDPDVYLTRPYAPLRLAVSAPSDRRRRVRASSSAVLMERTRLSARPLKGAAESCRCRGPRRSTS